MTGIGIDINVGRLLVVDWIPAHGVWGDGLIFVFDGGVLNDQHISEIKPHTSYAEFGRQTP